MGSVCVKQTQQQISQPIQLEQQSIANSPRNLAPTVPKKIIQKRRINQEKQKFGPLIKNTNDLVIVVDEKQSVQSEEEKYELDFIHKSLKSQKKTQSERNIAILLRNRMQKAQVNRLVTQIVKNTSPRKSILKNDSFLTPKNSSSYSRSPQDRQFKTKQVRFKKTVQYKMFKK